MAGSQGPTVKLTFAGDAVQLDKTMAGVGASSDKMAKQVGESSSKLKGSFDSAGEGADASEQKFQGVADVTSGIVDGFQGITDGSLSMSERLQLLGGAGADLAGGFAALLPLIGTMATSIWGAITATWSFTAALLANPITWVVIAIVALIAIIVLMITHWDKVKAVVSSVVGWIRDRWNDAVGWLGGIADKIGNFFVNMWDGMKQGAKAALNFVIDNINNAVKALNFLIQGINYIPGVSIPYIPYIPRFHTGGVVPGVAGSEMLAVLQAGERVIPATGPASGGGGTVTFAGDTDGAFATAFMNLVRSGHIQLSAVA